MGKVFAATRLLVDTSTVAQETFAPNVAGSALGSFWIQAGAFPATPVDVWSKLTAGISGWCRQNVINLGVFNVKNFGAVGDGITDDTTAINNTVNAAKAAGGGTVYFPAPGVYKITKPVAGIGSVVLDNAHDLVFLGDGAASQIAMIGSAGAGDWYAFRVRDGTTRCGWYNLGWDGQQLTNPDPARQNHFLNFQGISPDAHGGPTNLDVVGNWFGPIVGAGVRHIGEITELVDNSRVLLNAFDMSNGVIFCRSNVEAQRGTRRVMVHFNYCTGTHDNLIDFEPTGTSGTGDEGPENWSVIGNHLQHGSTATSAITLSGASVADPNRRCVVAYNVITNGGDVQGIDMFSVSLIGNIITVDSTTANSCLTLGSYQENVTAMGNVLISLNSTNSRAAISCVATVGNGQRCSFVDNIGAIINVAAAGGVGFNLESFTECMANGNIISANDSQVGKAIGIKFRATNVESDRVMAHGNMVLALNQSLLDAVDFAASPNNFHNSVASYNWINVAVQVVGWERAAAQTFLDWRLASCNLIVTPTTAVVTPPPTNVGVTFAGEAGPGAQMVQVATTPAGNVQTPVGGMVLNTAGAQATIVWYKETAAGLAGGTAGWVADGGSELQFGTQDTTNATAARFMAPGMAQVTASTVEIKIPLPRPGTIRNGRLTATAGVGGGNNTYTFRRNGANTSVAVTVANTATSGTLSGSAVCAAGDLLSMQVTKSLAPGTDQTNVVVDLQLTG
jgi:hypothetical protein